jgi:hypothetical protein
MTNRAILVVLAWLPACSPGGDASDDLADLVVLSHSPGNGEQLNESDAVVAYNALDNPTLATAGAVTVVFSASLDAASVLDPADPQGTRNLRLFYFDPDQGPFDPDLPVEPGVNPPGANTIVPATTTLASTHSEHDTLVIRPTGLTETAPLRRGQYSVVVPTGVRAADGSGLSGAEHFFFFRVGPDTLPPSVLGSIPSNGSTEVEPDAEIRIFMSETIQAGSLSSLSISVSFQPAGAALPTEVPGFWYTDGGNQAGNNSPQLQLDANGNPGFSGVSPRNGADLVFRPELGALPINMRIEDPLDPLCTLSTDPPDKGNRGFPLGQAITVALNSLNGITDTAGHPVAANGPNNSFVFFTRRRPKPIYAPGTSTAIYYADSMGVGVIDANISRWPWAVPPARPQESVVTDADGRVVRMPVREVVDMRLDTRPYTAFYMPGCSGQPRYWAATLFVATREGGGAVSVVDTYRMIEIGRITTPTPGGLCQTALAGDGMLIVTNTSANTATVFDIGRLGWLNPAGGFFLDQASVALFPNELLLDENDFARLFPAQRIDDPDSPIGPPVIGTVITGTSPSGCDVTEYQNAWGFAPQFSRNRILGVLNSGDASVDFTELNALQGGEVLAPHRPGVNLGSTPTDIEWTPAVALFGTGRHFAYMSTIGGTVELFISGGGTAGAPTVKQGFEKSFAPNALVNSIGNLNNPTSIQFVTDSAGIISTRGYGSGIIVTETGSDRILALSVTQQYPSNLFEIVSSNLSAGRGPTSVAGDPVNVRRRVGSPRFTQYYVANAGEGTVRKSSYLGGTIGVDIQVPGVQRIATWWKK